MRGRTIALMVFGSVFIPLVSGGCLCTQALWDRVNPNERVWMSSSRITEEELKQKGLEYEKYQFTRGQPSQRGIDGYLVEKSDLQKCGDYVLLVAATPVAVVIDGVFVGAVVVACLSTPLSCP